MYSHFYLLEEKIKIINFDLIFTVNVFTCRISQCYMCQQTCNLSLTKHHIQSLYNWFLERFYIFRKCYISVVYSKQNELKNSIVRYYKLQYNSQFILKLDPEKYTELVRNLIAGLEIYNDKIEEEYLFVG